MPLFVIYGSIIFVQEKRLILLDWHQFLNESVILNRKSLDKVLMLLRFLILMTVIEAFVVQKQHFSEEVTEWSGILREVRNKFS